MTPTPKETAMNDQTTPANLTRKEARAVREWAERAWNTKVQDATVAHAARVLLAVLPPRPTLAGMTVDDRRACKWMQADVDHTRAVIIRPAASGGPAALLDRWGDVNYVDHADVTPRPDLPRMEWPGTEKPDPAPALPDGWMLADHKDYGRVIVTNPTPNRNGRVHFVIPADDPEGYGWNVCDPDKLTYIDTDQGADTSDAVPPNTMAVGSEWHDADTLAEACRESGRDQIIALDRVGNAYVWDEMAEWWEGSAPPIFAPYTIIHAGKKADQ